MAVIGLVLLVCTAYCFWRVVESSGREGRTAPPISVTPSSSVPIHIREITPTEEDLTINEPDDSVVLVEHVTESYWEETGWHPEGRRLIGYYRTPFGSFEGYIERWRTGEPKFYIVRPPRELRDCEHWVCFRARGSGHYWVHFGQKPRTPDTGIVEIERILTEALSPSGTRS